MESSSIISALAGLAGSMSGLILYPLEYIKINIIAGDGYSKNYLPRYKNVREAVFEMYKNQGLASFYKGCHVSLFSSVSWTIYFYLYDIAKKKHDGIRESRPFLFKFLVASEASVLARVITSPLWVVKTRLILQKRSSSWLGDTGEVVKKIWVTDGPAGFFAGLVPGLVLCINGVLNLFVYEIEKEYFHSASWVAIGGYGMVSKMISTVFSYPCQIVMIKLQQEQYSSTILKKANEVVSAEKREKFFSGSWNCMKTVYAKEGVRGFYRGFTLQIARTLPGNGLFFILYEEFLKHFN